MGLKAKVKELVRLAHTAEQAYLDALSEEKKVIVGKSDDWGPKDVVAHMTAWKEEVVTNYQASKRDDELPEEVDYEVRNAQFFEQYRDSSWAEILEYRNQTYQRLIESLEGMSEADLASTEGIAYQRGRPFWQMITSIACIHPITHLRDPLLARGDFARAVEIQEQATGLLSELDGDQTWLGAQRYNLACTYSLVGQKDKAIRILRESLKMTPDLKEWSKEDPDFKPIREHPDYKAIYAE